MDDLIDFFLCVHYTVYQDFTTTRRRAKMAETHVSIGQVKRDISKLVNRVAYGGERVVLTSRGKPKAALVSIADYERLQGQDLIQAQANWQAWRQTAEKLSASILQRRDGKAVDVEGLWESARSDLEERDERLLGR
jgi:prevent-host-death family protein